MIVKSRYYEVINEIIEKIDIDGKVCVDCTLGNGNDSLKILSNMKDGFLYGLDIQQEAIENSKKLLEKNGFSNFKLIKDSHSNLKKHIDTNAELIVYNLGYLPRMDKNIITKPDTTIASIGEALELISDSGVIIVVSYLGHKGSYGERYALDAYLSKLDQDKYLVEKREFFNQVNTPPVVYLIKKRC